MAQRGQRGDVGAQKPAQPRELRERAHRPTERPDARACGAAGSSGHQGARATARLADAPAWMREAKLEFPALDADEPDRAQDSTDEALLRVALDEMETHPDVSAAGEAIRYLYRLSCNVAESPKEPRFRRLRVDNTAYVNHALGVRGGTLAMEALGWRVLVVWSCETRDLDRLAARLESEFSVTRTDVRDASSSRR